MPLFNSVLARRTFGYLLAGTLALLAIVAASIWLAARTVNHADEIARARSVRTLASTVLGALLDAETGQRGFLLTHADRYLEPYEQARQRLPTRLVESAGACGERAAGHRDPRPAGRGIEPKSSPSWPRRSVWNRAVSMRQPLPWSTTTSAGA